MKSTVNEIIRRPPELAGLEVPEYRVIDGVDQISFFAGERKNSNRDGFPLLDGRYVLRREVA
jgi:hypothetical protein